MADNDYKVGYKRPPLETRFKKGVSGCPDGGAEIKKKKKAERERRAAQRTVGDVLRDICNEQVPVTINGKRTKMAKLEIMMRKVVDQAATGDRPAFKDVRDLLARTGQLKPPAERGDQACLLSRLLDLEKTGSAQQRGTVCRRTRFTEFQEPKAC